ncbi:MAG: hypothetical protein HY923_03840 [Elusimicrobia bacterium]|nr:hypothetical protein [Elusimicrobiota bacterium]
MRPSFKPAVLAALLLLAPAGASAQRGRSYDPEVALLVLTIQKASVQLLREELVRQAEWLELGGMQVLLAEKVGGFAKNVTKGLTADSDILEDYRQQILKVDPTAIGEVDKLINEIRRYHDLVPGPPMVRLPWPPPPGPQLEFLEEDGIGADAASALKGTPAMDEPVAYAERRFGTTGPFLRHRMWNLDFYLGSFSDLLLHYKKLGYRRIYRLRSPYVSYGKEAYVLSPEPGLRPRVVYCGFYGQDLFLHTRAQWAILTERGKGESTTVRTLTCPSCTWVLPGVRAMRSLLATVPYSADTVVVGYDYLFEPEWKDQALGVYENDYWRLSYFKTGPTISATVVPRRTNFGEILAASLTPLVRRGAKRVYYAGPAARVDEGAAGDELQIPTDFAAFTGSVVAFENALLPRKPKKRLFAALPSPLLATREWLKDAAGHDIVAFDGEMARLAEEAAAWGRIRDHRVECGIGAVLAGLANLHPEEDRAVYTISYESQAGKESAKRRYRDLVLGKIKTAGKAAEE